MLFCFSFDGVPFILHDNSLRRTTNVASVFPDLIDKDPSYFNISQLKMISAGDWFIQVSSPVNLSVFILRQFIFVVMRGKVITTIIDIFFSVRQDKNLSP